MEFGNLNDLVARIASSVRSPTGRPVAILCGSGLTVPHVPSVNKIIQIIRKDLPAQDQVDLDELLASKKLPAEKYQAAFRFLSYRRDPGFKDRVIQLATMHAYADDLVAAPKEIRENLGFLESQTDKWDMPDGILSLGRIWAGLSAKSRGPILTTNFDPLAEIAIRRAGGTATTQISADDSSFLSNMRVQMGSVVVHLHGYWREAGTMHTPQQLALDRPTLAACLRVILKDHTLLVVGYGGWSDVVSRSINAIIREQSSTDLDILWCMFEKGESLEAAFNDSETLRELGGAPGNIVFYSDIDTNALFPLLESRIADHLDYSLTTRESSGSGSLVGWTSITSDLLQKYRSQQTLESAMTFFDGRLPNWRDATSGRIPRRDVVASASNYLKSIISKRDSSFTFIEGPSGEGKSTAIMQICTLLRDSLPDLAILYQDGDYFGSESDFLSLPGTNPYLLVIDDAHRFTDRLKEIARQLNSQGRNNIHILLATRDSDWRINGGDSLLWSQHVVSKKYTVRGISRVDAAAVVGAWESLGPEALGDLAKLVSTEDRISALVAAGHDPRFASEGTFLGALLTTRYGSGLTEHIRELLLRLSYLRLPDSAYYPNGNLLHALATIALPHANGVYQMNFEVLATALGISEPELHVYVLTPLGKEAAISYVSHEVLVRHSYIAEVMCELLPEFNIDLEKTATRIVSAAVSIIDSKGYDPEIGDLAYLSNCLSKHEHLAVPAARAAVLQAPERFSYRTRLSAALRSERRHEEAAAADVDASSLLQRVGDPAGIRAFLNEWGVAEGNCSRYARNAFLAGLALQDSDSLGPLNAAGAAHSLICLQIALRKLYSRYGLKQYVEAIAVTVVLWHSLAADRHGQEWAREERWSREASQVVEQAGLAFPDLATSTSMDDTLKTACLTARAQLEQDLPAAVPPGQFKFRTLFRLAGAR